MKLDFFIYYLLKDSRFSSDSGSSLKGATFGILESFVGAHSLNILSRLRSLPGGPSGGGVTGGS